MTGVYRSSGKAINPKIHKYSLYHTVRQDPKPIPGQIMDQMFTEKSSRGKTTLHTEESRVTPVPQEHDCIIFKGCERRSGKNKPVINSANFR